MLNRPETRGFSKNRTRPASGSRFFRFLGFYKKQVQVQIVVVVVGVVGGHVKNRGKNFLVKTSDEFFHDFSRTIYKMQFFLGTLEKFSIFWLSNKYR